MEYGVARQEVWFEAARRVGKYALGDVQHQGVRCMDAILRMYPTEGRKYSMKTDVEYHQCMNLFKSNSVILCPVEYRQFPPKPSSISH